MMSNFKKLSKTSVPPAPKVAPILNGIANGISDGDTSDEEKVNVSRTTRSMVNHTKITASAKTKTKANYKAKTKANNSRAKTNGKSIGIKAKTNGKTDGISKIDDIKPNAVKMSLRKTLVNKAIDNTSSMRKVIDTKTDISKQIVIKANETTDDDDSKANVSQTTSGSQIKILEPRTHNLLPDFPLRNVMDLKLLNINIVDVRCFKAQLVTFSLQTASLRKQIKHNFLKLYTIRRLTGFWDSTSAVNHKKLPD